MRRTQCWAVTMRRGAPPSHELYRYWKILEEAPTSHVERIPHPDCEYVGTGKKCPEQQYLSRDAGRHGLKLGTRHAGDELWVTKLGVTDDV